MVENMGFAVAKYLLDKLYKQNLWGLGLNLELLRFLVQFLVSGIWKTSLNL